MKQHGAIVSVLTAMCPHGPNGMTVTSLAMVDNPIATERCIAIRLVAVTPVHMN